MLTFYAASVLALARLPEPRIYYVGEVHHAYERPQARCVDVLEDASITSPVKWPAGAKACGTNVKLRMLRQIAYNSIALRWYFPPGPTRKVHYFGNMHLHGLDVDYVSHMGISCDEDSCDLVSPFVFLGLNYDTDLPSSRVALTKTFASKYFSMFPGVQPDTTACFTSPPHFLSPVIRRLDVDPARVADRTLSWSELGDTPVAVAGTLCHRDVPAWTPSARSPHLYAPFKFRILTLYYDTENTVVVENGDAAFRPPFMPEKTGLTGSIVLNGSAQYSLPLTLFWVADSCDSPLDTASMNYDVPWNESHVFRKRRLRLATDYYPCNQVITKRYSVFGFTKFSEFLNEAFTDMLEILFFAIARALRYVVPFVVQTLTAALNSAVAALVVAAADVPAWLLVGLSVFVFLSLREHGVRASIVGSLLSAAVMHAAEQRDE